MFLGSFLANTSSLDATPVHSENTTLVEITNGVFDDIYMDSDLLDYQRIRYGKAFDTFKDFFGEKSLLWKLFQMGTKNLQFH